MKKTGLLFFIFILFFQLFSFSFPKNIILLAKQNITQLSVKEINLINQAISNDDSLSYLEVEELSYSFFLEGQWNYLIKLGEKAISQNIDYYYLRMRLGIAYYNKKKYFKATQHFRKAFEFNKADSFLQEYLYFSLLFSDQIQEAIFLSKNFDTELNARLQIKKNEPIKFAYLESGQKNSRYDSKYALNIGNMPFLHAGLAHSLNKTFNIYHGYSYLQQELSFGTIRQNEYYLKTEIPVGKGWTISPATHAIFLQYNTKDSSISPSFLDTYILGSLQIEKYYAMFRFGMAVSYGNISQIKQLQFSPEIGIYPLQNTKLVLTTNFYMLNQDFKTSQNYIGFKQALRLQILKPLWLNVDYFQGEMKNFNESNAFLINNSFDLTQNRINALANYTVYKPLQVYIGGQYEQKKESFSSLNYQYYTFLAGIKYNF